MIVQFAPFGIIFVVCSFLALFLIKYGYDDSDRYITFSFIGLGISLFLCLLFEGLYEIFNPLFLKLLTAGLSSLGYSFLGLFWFLFVMAYIKRTVFFNKYYIIILSIIPLITVFAGVTEPWLYLLWHIKAEVTGLVFERTIIFWLEIAYSFILGLIATVILFVYLFKQSNSFKMQVALLLFAILSPLIAATLRFTELFTTFNLLPLSFLISVVLIIIAVFHYNSLYYVPLVHERFIDTIDIGMVFFNHENKLIDLNSASKLIGLDKSYIGDYVENIFKDNNQLYDFYKNAESNEKMEYFVEDSSSWIEISKEEVFDKYDSFIGFVFTLTDITSNKELLLEKDMLLKEVHHRVKNNLQIILSLLNLDVKFHPDDLESIIEDTKARINTMALIHEKVYNSSSLHDLNLKDYLIDIANSILRLYDSKIKINDELIDLHVDLELAIPLGLIVIELINNVIKYAFPDDGSGNILIKLTVDGDLATLIFCDDGVGLADDIDIFNSPSLGLTVVNSLVQQLEGTLSLCESCEGAGFKIEFKYS